MIYGNILKTWMGHKTIYAGLLALMIPCMIYILLNLVRNEVRKKKIGIFILLLCMGVIIRLTLVNRVHDHPEINLMPFWSYARFPDPQYRWQIYMNVFLFVPYGFLWTIVSKRKLCYTILAGILFSVAIEMVQYLFCLGLCEFDDVFHNTIGTIIGFGYYNMLNWIRIRLLNMKIFSHYHKQE